MNEPTTATQNADVLAFMRDHGSITAMDAFSQLNITRLSARIWDLRRAGFEIIGTDKSKNENGRVIRWREYRLA